MRVLARRPTAFLALAAVALLTATPAGAHDGVHQRLVGYFTQWGIYGKGYVVKNVEDSGAARHLTHIQYAFANVTPDGKCGITDAWADYQKTFTAAQNLDGVDETWSDTELRLSLIHI